jgi:Xaa-Pro aminopeptidase
MTKNRLSSVRDLMKQKNLDAVLISSVPNIIYLTNFNHFYSEEREGFLVITKKNNYILTDKRYTEAVKKHVKGFTLCEIAYMQGFEYWIKTIVAKEHVKSLGVEENNLTIKEEKIILPFVKALKHFDLSTIRMTKSADELVALQTVNDIADKTFLYLLTQIKPGQTEKELATLLEMFARHHDADLAFNTIVGIEENGAYIHHKTNDKKLKKNNCILLDFGLKYNNYCSDMSRTFFFGKASTEQKKAYQTVLSAQEKAIEYIEKQLKTKQQINGADVDKVARDYIIEQGYASFAHGLGHGIGLEVHEAPHLRPPSVSNLDSGMVFSIEPGIYLTDKFGIRIEDIFAIQNGKLIRLSKSPRDLLEL